MFADFADAPTRPDPPDRLSRVHAAASDRGRSDAIRFQAAAHGSLLARRSAHLILAGKA